MLYYAGQKLEGSILELKSKLKSSISKKTWQDLEDEGVFFKLNNKPLTMIVGSKWGRVAMHSNLLTLKDHEKINWQFKNFTWEEITKTDLFLMHTIINRHLAENAAWEKNLHEEIDLSSTIKELQNIADKGTWIKTKTYEIVDNEIIDHVL